LEIQLVPLLSPTPTTTSQQSPAQDGINSFKDLLDQALQGVDALQKNAEQTAANVATGNASSFHEAIIAGEKASLALLLTTQVQNKIVDAYNEIMRMQL